MSYKSAILHVIADPKADKLHMYTKYSGTSIIQTVWETYNQVRKSRVRIDEGTRNSLSMGYHVGGN